MEPLNPYLYARLEQEFGEVLIAKEGERFLGQQTLIGGKAGLTISDYGESYRVNCFACAFKQCWDTRHRLYISHRWGSLLPDGKPSWFLAKCFNENCLAQPDYRRQLRQRIYGNISRTAREALPIHPGKVESRTLQDMALPGVYAPLNELAATHLARLYLQSRAFDPDQISLAWGVVYCDYAPPPFEMASGKLVVPIYVGQRLVGWQARKITDGSWDNSPKYYTCPGFPKRLTLYNLSAAMQTRLAILVEGVTDCWAVGNCGVAMLGKTLSQQQAEILTTRWRDGVIVVMLDGDAQDQSQEMLKLLHRALPGQVLHIALPAGVDPASCPRHELYTLLFQTGQQAGLDLSLFAKPRS